jgi:hypothetical protein
MMHISSDPQNDLAPTQACTAILALLLGRKRICAQTAFAALTMQFKRAPKKIGRKSHVATLPENRMQIEHPKRHHNHNAPLFSLGYYMYVCMFKCMNI